MPKNIELLSPAKNLECGLAAIDSGADAVYIGAAAFGARAAASNSLSDIERLVNYAHRFRAKVLITLNTILTDKELLEAERLVHSLYDIGADALIVQDMGLLQLDLPPIALHASTQTDNRTVDKVKFLQSAGFQRVVLARELSLEQIADISASTDVELEAFVHGSLCVSYSGQCYMSQAVCGRSANRGACAQLCRLPYSLVDSDGRVLADKKHLLSLKDMDRSDYLYDMMKAGISSFKIEGRLKDIDYVKNITAYYRKRIDSVLGNDNIYTRSSFGVSTFGFEPDPERTFHRGKTDYFLTGERKLMSQPASPKSVGKYVGKITLLKQNSVQVKLSDEIHNGDGLCFIDDNGNFAGFRVNRSDGNELFPAEMPHGLNIGTKLYRNFDFMFQKILKQKSSERNLWLDIEFVEANDGFSISFRDEAGDEAELSVDSEKIVAKNKGVMANLLEKQFGKLGNTIFSLRNFTFNCKGDYFFPVSLIAEWRRRGIELLLKHKDEWRPAPVYRNDSFAVFPEITLDYRANVMNSKAKKFYTEHGSDVVENAFEVGNVVGAEVMRCKFCLRYEMGICRKFSPPRDSYPKEPLFLIHDRQRFILRFDCQKCEMSIVKE